MTEIATVRVQILGREFPVACPAGQEHELEAAAEFVDHKMREIQEKTGNSALERLAVMARSRTLDRRNHRTRPRTEAAC